MGSTVTNSVVIKRPVAEVFAFVDDHRNTVRYVVGLAEWRPVGERQQGPGARFALTKKTRGLPDLRSEVEVVDWRANELIEYVSISGFENSGAYTFAAADGGTRVTLTNTYDLSTAFGADRGGFFGGVARRLGIAAGRATEGRVTQDLKASLEKLRQLVEALPRADAAVASAAKRTAIAAAAATKRPAPLAKSAPASKPAAVAKPASSARPAPAAKRTATGAAASKPPATSVKPAAAVRAASKPTVAPAKAVPAPKPAAAAKSVPAPKAAATVKPVPARKPAAKPAPAAARATATKAAAKPASRAAGAARARKG